MPVISRRECLSGITSLCAANALGAMQIPAESRRPNVIIVLSDDQGYGDLSCHGNPWLKTPCIDSFAKQGTELTRFYVSPLCSPTRSSILTGRYNLRCGVHGVTRGYQTMRSGETTIAADFKSAGYKTAIFGKWHLGSVYPYVPYAEGFDEFIGFRQGHEINYWNSMLEKNGTPYPVKGFITDVLTDESIRYIDSHRSDPFFLYLAFNVPHTPSQAPRDLFEHYRQFDISDYDASIYAMMANLDSNVGRLLTHLNQMNLEEDTIVIFASDNGPNGYRYNCGFRGMKGQVDEGGVRVPFFIRWPGHLRKNVQMNEMAAHIDLYPTLLSLCGITPLKGKAIDGIDLSGFLKRQELLPDRKFFTHHAADTPKLSDSGAVRTNRYCLVDQTKLYDLLKDPCQNTDIASEHPEQVKVLGEAYDRWFEDVTKGVDYGRLPIQVGHPEENPVTMPATQAYFTGALHFWGKDGWAWDWVTGWTNQKDEIYWDIEVVQAGKYLVDLRYLCPASDVGSRIQVQAGENVCESIVQYATSMQPIPTIDLVPRVEVPPMPWGTLSVGLIDLPKGRMKIHLKALSKRGTTVMEVKSMSLRLLDVPESI